MRSPSTRSSRRSRRTRSATRRSFPLRYPRRWGAGATGIVRKLVVEIDAAGIVAVEFFLTDDGVLINELAPSPQLGSPDDRGLRHLQFEQHLGRCWVGRWARPSCAPPAVALANILGPADGVDPSERGADLLTDPDVRLHLYGKSHRPGRKLGHVTVLGSDIETAREKARRTLARLDGGGE
ncbi:MAG: ATP-grasp domain-containing protein [Actinobacteria bacterium]|nr:ATP-grasp domain-containing protein [Actinomycetota bacterium]